jgi:type IV pilus assembly protein PilV
MGRAGATRWTQRTSERGMTLMESLVAMLLFAIGVLALVAMYANAIAFTGDARFRAEAAELANMALQRMASESKRDGSANIDTSNGANGLKAYEMRADAAMTTAAPCGPMEAVPASQPLSGWGTQVTARMPGGWPPVVTVDPAQSNRVSVRICWSTNPNATPHAFDLVGYLF